MLYDYGIIMSFINYNYELYRRARAIFAVVWARKAVPEMDRLASRCEIGVENVHRGVSFEQQMHSSRSRQQPLW